MKRLHALTIENYSMRETGSQRDQSVLSLVSIYESGKDEHLLFGCYGKIKGCGSSHEGHLASLRSDLVYRMKPDRHMQNWEVERHQVLRTSGTEINTECRFRRHNENKSVY